MSNLNKDMFWIFLDRLNGWTPCSLQSTWYTWHARHAWHTWHAWHVWWYTWNQWHTWHTWCGLLQIVAWFLLILCHFYLWRHGIVWDFWVTQDTVMLQNFCLEVTLLVTSDVLVFFFGDKHWVLWKHIIVQDGPLLCSYRWSCKMLYISLLKGELGLQPL